jgi:hypothetical protein
MTGTRIALRLTRRQAKWFKSSARFTVVQPFGHINPHYRPCDFFIPRIINSGIVTLGYCRQMALDSFLPRDDFKTAHPVDGTERGDLSWTQAQIMVDVQDGGSCRTAYGSVMARNVTLWDEGPLTVRDPLDDDADQAIDVG